VKRIEKNKKCYNKKLKGSFNVRISPELHRKVALAAANQKITLNQYIVKAIMQSFEEGANGELVAQF